MTEGKWEVYIIQAKSGALYTGITNDLEKRFEAHEKGVGARFFHTSSPEKIVYREAHPDRSSASKREYEIKQMSRLEKLALIKIVLPKDDEALLAECRVDTYRASGKGGQHVNMTDSAVRLKHLSTGIVITCQKERSQYLNKIECLAKLREKVEKLNYIKPERKKTHISHSTKNKNKAKQMKESEKKRLRRPPSQD